MLTIEFGALAAPIEIQVNGLKRRAIAKFQGDADAVSRLYIHGILSVAEAGKARKRLVKAIEKELSRC